MVTVTVTVTAQLPRRCDLNLNKSSTATVFPLIPMPMLMLMLRCSRRCLVPATRNKKRNKFQHRTTIEWKEKNRYVRPSVHGNDPQSTNRPDHDTLNNS